MEKREALQTKGLGPGIERGKRAWASDIPMHTEERRSAMRASLVLRVGGPLTLAARVEPERVKKPAHLDFSFVTASSNGTAVRSPCMACQVSASQMVSSFSIQNVRSKQLQECHLLQNELHTHVSAATMACAMDNVHSCTRCTCYPTVGERRLATEQALGEQAGARYRDGRLPWSPSTQRHQQAATEESR